jgi:hypothetical protein
MDPGSRGRPNRRRGAPDGEVLIGAGCRAQRRKTDAVTEETKE